MSHTFKNKSFTQRSIFQSREAEWKCRQSPFVVWMLFLFFSTMIRGMASFALHPWHSSWIYNLCILNLCFNQFFHREIVQMSLKYLHNHTGSWESGWKTGCNISPWKCRLDASAPGQWIYSVLIGIQTLNSGNWRSWFRTGAWLNCVAKRHAMRTRLGLSTNHSYIFCLEMKIFFRGFSTYRAAVQSYTRTLLDWENSWKRGISVEKLKYPNPKLWRKFEQDATDDGV